jgi:leucyl/phenylalanyl-tRNA---protein transferase
LHIAKRLQRTIKQDLFEVRVDSNFDAIIDGCGSMRAGRDTTWINAKIRKLYGDLYDLGHCHTVEVWRDGELAGGLYGVALEGAFFGESMFSYQTDASKVALVHLLARLIAGKFTLRATFHKKLDRALKRPADFLALPKATSGAAALQIIAAGQLCPTKRL